MPSRLTGFVINSPIKRQPPPAATTNAPARPSPHPPQAPNPLQPPRASSIGHNPRSHPTTTHNSPTAIRPRTQPPVLLRIRAVDPVRGHCCPGRLGWLVVGGRLAAWRRGVGLVCGWSRVRSAGPGRDGCHRLVVARPLRGRGLCLVLRIRCCPSTTWPLPPWSASPDSRSGAVVHWASGGWFGRCAGVPGSLRLGGGCCGVHVDRRLGVLGGVCVRCSVSSGVRGVFCLVVPRFRPGKHETRTRRPAQTRAPGKTAGQASSQALGVSSGSVFGPEERAGAGMGCETRHGHRSPGAAAGTTAPDRESGDAVQGSNGHVVDGQQRMRSTKQKPRPRRGRATT
ncbi:hypothetical protein ABIA38_007366, partial [Embleya sp. AB8]